MGLEELAHIWIIVCPLVFLGGLIDAVAGGGGLITLPAYLLAGLPAHMASGTNKCGNAFGTFLSTGRFLKRGDVHIASAAAGAVGALVGAWVGAQLNLIMPEQMLYYSDNCFGTADAISFKQNVLRIHDLKTGEIPAHMEQLLIYAALFCLEYRVKPGDIQIELRIYQHNEILLHEPTADEILPIMDKIISFDKVLKQIKEEEG